MKEIEKKIEKAEARYERAKEREPERLERIRRHERAEERYDAENAAYLESFDADWGDNDPLIDARRYEAELRGDIRIDRAEAEYKREKERDRVNRLEKRLEALKAEAENQA